MKDLLRRIELKDLVDSRFRARDPQAEEAAANIIADVTARGEEAVREWAEKLGDLAPGAKLVLGKEDLARALD